MTRLNITCLLFGLLLPHLSFGQWTPLPTGTTEDLYAVDFLDDLRGVAVGNNSTILLTTDGGNSWAPANTGELKADFRSVVMLSADTILAGAGTIFEGQLYRSVNGGQSWAPLIEVSEITAAGAGLISFDDEAVYYSTDKGGEWNATGLDIGNTTLMEAFHFADPDTGYLSGNVSGFTTYSFYGYRTVNGGTEWAPLWVFDLPNNNAQTTLATPDPDTVFLFNNRFENYLPGSDNQLVRLSGFYYDNDQEKNSWRFSAEIINDALPALMISSLFLDGSRGFAGSLDGDLYETTDGGQNWSLAYDGDTSLNEIVAIDEGLLMAAGGNGLLLKYQLNTDVEEPTTSTAVRIYPNPTRESIFLENPHLISGQLKIFGANGQFIREADWEANQPISVRDLPAGMYLLELRSGPEIRHSRFLKQ